MRKLLIMGTVAVSLAGCAGMNNPFTGQPITPADVQNAAVTACGFLPTASTVTALITTSSSVQTAEQIASIICAAVVPAKAGRLRGAPMVNGIVIHGRFVR